MRRMKLFIVAPIILPALWGLAAAQEPPAPVGDPAITTQEAVPVISWEDPRPYMDREVFVVGKVVATKRTKTMCFLNFDTDIRVGITIAIRGENVDRFPEPPERAYRGKTIKVRGWVSEYRGLPQILVSRPEQITILPDDAPLPQPPPPSSRPAPRVPGVVTIATYNVENLFDAVDDPYTGDEGTPPKSRAAFERLSATIHALNADVLALQEVENRGILDQFNRVFLSDLGYSRVVLVEGNDARGIDVAVLTRLPVGPVTTHQYLRFLTDSGREIGFRRDLLQVRIEPPGARPFDVFVTHLKHKEGDADEASLDIRMGEVKAARAILDARLKQEPDARFVLCGDLNDLIDSRPIQHLIGSGPTALRSFHEEFPPDRRITFNKEPYRSMIDYILCSPSMARTYVPKSYRILEGTQETSGSDHNPVAIDLKLSE